MIPNKYVNNKKEKEKNKRKIIVLIILIILMLILSFFLVRICFFSNEETIVNAQENIDVSDLQTRIDVLCDLELIEENKDEIIKRINEIDYLLNDATSEERFLLDLTDYEKLKEYIDELDNVLYEIKATVNNEKLGSVIGGGKYLKDSVVKLEAKGKESAKFVEWSDGNKDNPRQIIVTKDMELQANFSGLYTISTYSNDNAMGMVSGAGEYFDGSKISIHAKPNKGYEFVRWSDDVTSNPRQVIVKKSESYTAIFSKAISFGYVSTNNSSGGYIDCDEQLQAGRVYTLNAIANKGYRFVKWSDGDRSNPRTLEISPNKEYVAIFEPIVYTITWDTRGVSNASFQTSTVTVESGINNIPSVENTDEYKFIGWYLDSSDVTHTGNKQISTGTIPESDMICYAVYGKKQTVYRYSKAISKSDNLVYESSSNSSCLVPNYPEYYVLTSVNEEYTNWESNAGVCGVSRVDNGYHCSVNEWDGCNWVPCNNAYGECCCGREYVDVANSCEVTHSKNCPAYYEITEWSPFSKWSINEVSAVKESESLDELVKVETDQKYVYDGNKIWQG